MSLKRRFIDTPGGQIHALLSDIGGSRRPLVMIPQFSVLEQERLIAALGDRSCIALDLPGMGDSDPPADSAPSIGGAATTVIAALDALGVGEFDLYGSHQGARAAVEIAVQAPARVKHVVLDGAGLMDDARRAALAKDYAPPIKIDHHGSQLRWCWHFVRDSFLFWPHQEKKPENARVVGLPDPAALHDRTVQVLKNARSFHETLRATFEYPVADRLREVRCPALLSRLDEHCADILAHATTTEHDFYDAAQSTDAEVAGWARSIGSFLDNS
jgi:pimeloyl-ACP methyl ester carboxylesterase